MHLSWITYLPRGRRPKCVHYLQEAQALSTSQREDPPGLQWCGRSPVPAARTGPGCRCPGAASRPPPWQQGPMKPRLSAGPPAAPADTEQNRVSTESAGGVCPVLPGPRGGAPADKGAPCGHARQDQAAPLQLQVTSLKHPSAGCREGLLGLTGKNTQRAN